MELNQHIFPFSELNRVVAQYADLLGEHRAPGGQLETALTSPGEYVTTAYFKQIMSFYGAGEAESGMPEQAVITLSRAMGPATDKGPKGGGMISGAAFCAAINRGW